MDFGHEQGGPGDGESQGSETPLKLLDFLSWMVVTDEECDELLGRRLARIALHLCMSKTISAPRPLARGPMGLVLGGVSINS
jgi:hypothetical protein